MTQEQIENRIKILEPRIKRWKWMVGTAASGVLVTTGFILLLLNVGRFETSIFSVGIVFLFVGLIYLVINLRFLLKVNEYRKEYNSLIKQNRSTNNNEDKTTLLLKLLDEGKISKEEFDNLVK